LFVIFWAGFIDRKFTTHNGYYHLKAVRGPGINHWIFETIRPFVGQNILEAGCGIGNLTESMLNKESLTCVDIDPLLVELISRRFNHLENFTAVQQDIVELDSTKEIIKVNPDTIICLNVLELVKDDQRALRNFFDLLEPGGNLILLVPQHKAMFSPLDERFGHRRRYEKADLRKDLSALGFEVRILNDFNRLGLLGWLIYSKILRSSELPHQPMQLFNLFLPLVKQLDRLGFLPGISVLAVARKPIGDNQATAQIDGEQKRLRDSAMALR
ncbi:MAG TPA: class I SAM-dependent methyltransferase, partial [Chroococcales cyanobacterium]